VKLHLPLLLLLTLLLGSSCDQLQRAVQKPGGVFGPSESTLRTYHDSRWQAVVTACAEGRDAVELPAEPAVPRALQKLKLEESYAALAENRSSEELSWNALIAQSDLSLRFIAEMLDVLERNDADSISSLAPQIDDFTQKQDAALEDWRSLRQNLRGKLDTLRNSWDACWPANGLDLDLLADVERLQSEQLGTLSQERLEALTHYHDNEFARLSRDYLEFDAGEQEISQQAHVPQGCQGISSALDGLEAALVLRFALDTAIMRDMELVNSYVPGGIAGKALHKLDIPEKRYGAHRARLAVARLQLYKLLDALLTDVLDVMIYDLSRQWQLIWPGNGLENNIFAYAGVSPAPSHLADPYVEAAAP
jgi:hypothetical protein